MQYATAVKNLVFWPRLAAYCGVNVKDRLLKAYKCDLELRSSLNTNACR